MTISVWDANSQSAFPILNPPIPSRSTASVVFENGMPVAASISPQCSDICIEGQGY